jgi:sigma-E factor negative regulatory protein RseA
MNEELDSQLSAMFDNELPAGQCELLARRLSRDEDLKSRWAVYAAIGATIRAEGGARLNGQLARRVSVAISAEPAVVSTSVLEIETAVAEASAAQPAIVAQAASARPQVVASRWWAPVGGVAVAASVAAAAILWVRMESPQGAVVAQTEARSAGRTIGLSADTKAVVDLKNSYVVPKTNPRRSIVPSTQLANYVVAHSEFSSPVNRRNLLSTLMASEPGTAGLQSGSEEPTEDINDDATSPQ